MLIYFIYIYIYIYDGARTHIIRKSNGDTGVYRLRCSNLHSSMRSKKENASTCYSVCNDGDMAWHYWLKRKFILTSLETSQNHQCGPTWHPPTQSGAPHAKTEAFFFPSQKKKKNNNNTSQSKTPHLKMVISVKHTHASVI
jgi:hypothetical protein